MIEKILETYDDASFMKADGFDNAIIGVYEVDMRFIYSLSKCIDILKKDGMNYEEAREFFDFNVSGSYVGEKTPIWCYDDF
jgi:hypothetical protein